jgi:hypothetical protein
VYSDSIRLQKKSRITPYTTKTTKLKIEDTIMLAKLTQAELISTN